VACTEPTKAQTEKVVAKFIGHTKRADGRIELICEHGCGHPSKRLQELISGRPWAKYDGVHGCCGCCKDSEEFAAYEDSVLGYGEQQ